MKDYPPELIYVLLFAALLLFQFLKKRFAPREEEESMPEEPLPPIPAAVAGAPPGAAPAAMEGSHWGRAEPRRAPIAPRRRRFSRKSLMGTRRSVQNAMVIATILGPCRAFEPHDVR